MNKTEREELADQASFAALWGDFSRHIRELVEVVYRAGQEDALAEQETRLREFREELARRHPSRPDGPEFTGPRP